VLQKSLSVTTLQIKFQEEQKNKETNKNKEVKGKLKNK
jgi:hypothetical protein